MGRGSQLGIGAGSRRAWPVHCWLCAPAALATGGTCGSRRRAARVAKGQPHSGLFLPGSLLRAGVRPAPLLQQPLQRLPLLAEEAAQIHRCSRVLGNPERSGVGQHIQRARLHRFVVLRRLLERRCHRAGGQRQPGPVRRDESIRKQQRQRRRVVHRGSGQRRQRWGQAAAMTVRFQGATAAPARSVTRAGAACRVPRQAHSQGACKRRARLGCVLHR